VIEPIQVPVTHAQRAANPAKVMHAVQRLAADVNAYGLTLNAVFEPTKTVYVISGDEANMLDFVEATKKKNDEAKTCPD